MVQIINTSSDPFYNVACEEFLLNSFPDECFMLWKSSSSVVVGKHQNTLSEINYNFANTHNIPVIRRLSGGGAVFHDPGNINFTFITKNLKDKSIHFQKYLQPIIESLHKLSLDVTINSRNNLFLKNKKITGTAAHLTNKKVIHHGTLLFNSDLTTLKESLNKGSEKYFDKSIKSVSDSVTTIFEHLTEKIEVAEFMKIIEKHIKQAFNIVTEYTLTETDDKIIEQLAESKYRTWKWNYGYSPDYRFCNSVTHDEHTIKIELNVKKGIIECINLTTGFPTIDTAGIESVLIHQPHEINHLLNAITPLQLPDLIKNKLLQGLF